MEVVVIVNEDFEVVFKFWKCAESRLDLLVLS
jgi:hypothetical protein